MAIRRIREEDAEAFLGLCHALDAETTFMLLEPGERTATVEEQRERLRGILARANQTILVAEEEGRLVGYLAAFGGEYVRNRHCAHLVAGILQAHAGRGLGRSLFEALFPWAREAGLRRLELTVMAHNARGMALYTRMGFGVEGTRRLSLVVDGRDIDEYAMARLLE